MKLHHIGKVVDDIDKARKYYEETFQLKAVGEAVVDPKQKVKVINLSGEDNAAGVVLELIQPVQDDSPVTEFLKKGGGLHHLCFQVPDIQQALSKLKKQGALVLGPVIPSKGHEERASVWVYTRFKELVELVEGGTV